MVCRNLNELRVRYKAVTVLEMLDSGVALRQSGQGMSTESVTRYELGMWMICFKGKLGVVFMANSSETDFTMKRIAV